MLLRCKDGVFEDSESGFVDIGLGSGAGEAFDFEGGCDNRVMRDCLFHDTAGPGVLLCSYASGGNPSKGIRMANCVLNGKAKRRIGLPRCEVVNTADGTESTWGRCLHGRKIGAGFVAPILMRLARWRRDRATLCAFPGVQGGARLR